MKTIVRSLIFICFISAIKSQSFIRTELPTALTTPWEITYGPDGFLWITESGGRVSRVDPINGNKTVVYTAPDYFGGSPLEQLTLCFQPNIQFGTLGLALHPDFLNTSNSFIYYVYSYNSGTTSVPSTKFKIVRLTWSAGTSSVTAATDLVTQMPNGYDHIGGRLLAVTQNTNTYLYMSCGDNGISETNAPTCYTNQATNPNTLAQDPNYKNGKIHRFNIDGTIPSDNPIPGNSFYTRGHRNPQGLVYNPVQNVLYDIEHGDQTDDEINVLEAGMNYGWKYVRGYHGDNNFPGEAAYISSYVPYPSITGDALKEPIFAWCAVPQPTSTNNLDWCTVAPSDGIYYGSSTIPGWNNSILVVTLKDGASTDMEMYQFKLNANGLGVVPSTTLSPNPVRFFGSDQALNGRLRDIAISPDGSTLYLINNGGATSDKITVYTYNPVGIQETILESDINLYPNPNSGDFMLSLNKINEPVNIEIYNSLGQLVLDRKTTDRNTRLSINECARGIYYIRILQSKRLIRQQKIVKE